MPLEALAHPESVPPPRRRDSLDALPRSIGMAGVAFNRRHVTPDPPNPFTLEVVLYRSDSEMHYEHPDGWTPRPTYFARLAVGGGDAEVWQSPTYHDPDLARDYAERELSFRRSLRERFDAGLSDPATQIELGRVHRWFHPSRREAAP